MAHAHSLCSFVWGCGLNPEPDHTGGYTFQPPSPGHLPHSPAHEDGRQEVRRLSSQPVNSSFTCHTHLGRLADASRDFVLKQPCAVCSRWLMGPWRWRSWWRGWWSCSSSRRRRRSARKRRWWLVLRGRGARASQQVQTWTRFQKVLSGCFCTLHISFSNWVEASLTNTRLWGNLGAIIMFSLNKEESWSYLKSICESKSLVFVFCLVD